MGLIKNESNLGLEGSQFNVITKKSRVLTRNRKFKKTFLVKRSQYITIENPLHNQSKKACMCFKTRQASICDYMVTFFLFLVW